MCVDKKITSQMVILMMQQKIIVMDLTELVTLDLIEVIIMVLFEWIIKIKMFKMQINKEFFKPICKENQNS